MNHVKKVDRVGETNINTHNRKMTVIAYRGWNDVDIQFDDGVVLQHRAYHDFKNGNILYPGDKRRKRQADTFHLGETSVANNGQKMKIIAYRCTDDIDIEFEDGTIVEHTRYEHFKEGGIGNPSLKTHLVRIGKKNVASNGMTMTIIRYRNASDIDVRFDNGTIAEHRSYTSFRTGNIAAPGGHESKRLGEIGINNIGLRMTIIKYVSAKDITVQFDDGEINEHRHYAAFINGAIKHTMPFNIGNVIIDKPAYVHDNVGQFYCHCTECGLVDIMSFRDIQKHSCSSSDPSVVTQKYMADIRNTIEARCKKSRRRWAETHPRPVVESEHIGETTVNTEGKKMTLIKFRKWLDIDVKFEDGKIVKHTKYEYFRRGSIHHPKDQKNKDRTGTKVMAKCGLKMKIIRYRNASDIGIEFETGYVTENRCFTDFKRGNIKHPFPYQINDNLTLIKPAFIHNGKGNFYCVCSNCNINNIMTLKEARCHKCHGG